VTSAAPSCLTSGRKGAHTDQKKVTPVDSTKLFLLLAKSSVLVTKIVAVVSLLFGLFAAFGLFITLALGVSDSGSLSGLPICFVGNLLLAWGICRARPVTVEPAGKDAFVATFMTRRGGELPSHTFSSHDAEINDTPNLDLPDPKSVPVEVPLLVEEAKIACTTGMLLCLDRKQRLIFTLGEILVASDTVGSEILEMTADSFRQCLARARRDLYQFMNNQCGLVNANNPCRCPKKTKGFINAGHVDPHHLQFVPLHVRRIREEAADTVREIDDVVARQYAAIYREHPFLQPADQVQRLRQLLDRPDIRSALHLN
jgi:hypothetical protein